MRYALSKDQDDELWDEYMNSIDIGFDEWLRRRYGVERILIDWGVIGVEGTAEDIAWMLLNI